MDARALQSIARVALPVAFPLASIILDGLTRSQEAIAEAENSGDVPLEMEAKRQRIIIEYQAHTARVAQEYAIAERLAFADEVEIEEYHEGTGKGTAGVKLDGAAPLAGLSGEGRRVTKRIVRLRGTASATETDGEGRTDD